MYQHALVAILAICSLPTDNVFAQEASQPQPEQQSTPDRDPRFVGNTRGDLPIPTTPEELKSVSMSLWLKFRRTNQALYNFIRESSEFKAYAHACKRHDLNVNLAPINQLAHRNLQQIILAHYEEPDYAVLEAMPKQAQADLMKDIASDLYGFEYGYRVAQQDSVIKTNGITTNNYCIQVEGANYQKYIALLATAKRQLD